MKKTYGWLLVLLKRGQQSKSSAPENKELQQSSLEDITAQLQRR